MCVFYNLLISLSSRVTGFPQHDQSVRFWLDLVLANVIESDLLVIDSGLSVCQLILENFDKFVIHQNMASEIEPTILHELNYDTLEIDMEVLLKSKGIW